MRGLLPSLCIAAALLSSACSQTTSQSLTRAAVPATTAAPPPNNTVPAPAAPPPAAPVVQTSPQPVTTATPEPVVAAQPTTTVQPAAEAVPVATTTGVPIKEDGYPNINVVPNQPSGTLMPADERKRIIEELEAMRAGQSGPKPSDQETKALAAQAETHGADALKKIEKCSEEGAAEKYPECAPDDQ